MREYKKILLAVDITEGSEKIAERARDVAERYGAEAILLHVVEYVPVRGALPNWRRRRASRRRSASCRPATSRPSSCV